MFDKQENPQNTEENPESKSYLDEQAEGIKFLRSKFSDLHSSPEAISAAKRKKDKTGEKIPQKPEVRIANYLYRFREIMDNRDDAERQRGIEWLKSAMHRLHVIKPNKIPESEYLLEQRIAREMGHGDVEITEEFKERKNAQIINNQKESLDRWIDYLFSPDADYPDWAKYWAFRSMLNMGKFEKTEDEHGMETARFLRRRKDTVASFPTRNPRAIALTISALQSHLKEKRKPKAGRTQLENKSNKLNDREFQALVSTENFSKIYTQLLSEMPEYSAEGLKEIRGEWITYPQNSDAKPLVKSLEGYPLEWCTANMDTAQGHLEGGDFHIYYSINESGEAVIPRLAIRMEADKIAEVRGIAHDQNLDPYITPKLDEKLKNFGSEGEAYQKKSADMKRLTAIEKKQKQGEELTTEEIRFLYEADSPIEGFGYKLDPRIEEIKSERDIKEDVSIINIITTLEERSANPPGHYKRPEGIDIAKVKAALEANPSAKLSLAFMELTGGAPDIIAIESDAFIFGDCSAKSPNRRNLNYDQSAEMAKEFGVDMMSEDIYRKIQETGKFDMNSWSWLKTPADTREFGYARNASRFGDYLYVYRYHAGTRSPYGGWRASLRVPKA